MNKQPLILAVLLTALSTTAHAATIQVTASCPLTAAVARANALDSVVDPLCIRVGDTPGVEDVLDTIVFDAAVADLVPVANTIALTSAMTIDGAGRIILESTTQQRLFVVSADVTLNGLTLRGTAFPSGGVRVLSGRLVVTDATFTANSATYGGALHVDAGATVDVSDSAFIDNEARGRILTAVDVNPPNCAVPPVVLGSALEFTALAAATLTNTGPTIVDGDIGVSPGLAIVGFPPGLIVNGVVTSTTVAAAAQGDLTTAFNDAAGRTLCRITQNGDIGGMTLVPGLYFASTSMSVESADVTLDAQGDSNAVWIFQIGSTLTVGPGRKIILTNGAQAGNIFWQVGSSATIDTTAAFNGTIMAEASITVRTGASVNGRLLARSGAVTLDSNQITQPVAAEGPPVGDGTGGTGGGSEGGLDGRAEGGAVECFGTCSFDRVLFSGNGAFGVGDLGSALGGAINADLATLSVLNTTFVDNSVHAGLSALVTPGPTSANGGAIAAAGGEVDIAFATLSGNSAVRELLDLVATTSGGALHLLPALVDYTLFGALLTNNSASTRGDCNVVGDLVTSQSLFDTLTDRTDCVGTALTNLVGSASLSPLADNGGPTETMRISASSDARDHIATLDCGVANGLDQRGFPRPAGVACDIGALELELTLDNLSLDINGPSSHAIPPGAVAPQTVTMTWSITTPVAVDELTFDVTVSSGVTVTVYDADGLPVLGCTFDGNELTSCPLGAVAVGTYTGEIDLVFAATRTAAIAWRGSISYGFEDINPADDVDSGTITLTTCTPTGSADNTCNGVDDDCDGSTDEGFVATADTCGTGLCGATGVTTCALGVIGTTCVAGTPASSDGTCNNIDDDCDGSTDEGFAGTATTCGVGACSRTGLSTCVAGVTGTTCVAGAAAANDATCNNIDDDCNGATDEDVVAQATTCGVGACAASGTTTCVDGIAGSTCVAGTPAPIDNDCDGVDEDCDGGTDEGFAPISRICGDSCAGGAAITTCVAGRRVESACVPVADGAVCIDDGACTLAAACLGGACTVTRTRSCDDGNPCTADVCNDDSGCASTPVPNGGACNDSNPCTTADVCQGGVCAGPALACAAPDLCEEQGICNVATGVCAYAFILGCDPGCEPGEDTTPPELVCPLAKVAECTNGGNTVDVGTPTTRDDCSPVSVTSDASVIYPLGETLVTFTGRDAAGNTSTCTTLVTISDNDAPVLTCADDVVVAGDAETCSANVTVAEPTATDTCDGDGVSVVGPPLEAVFAAGTHLNTYFAVDAAGNQAQCTTSVTVTGDPSLTIDCAPTVTVQASADVCGSPDVVEAELVRGCGGASTTLESDEDLFPVGDTSVVYTVDEGGQTATCTTVVTVVDDTSPVVACGQRTERAGNFVFTATSSDACGATVTASAARCERNGAAVPGRCQLDLTDGELEVIEATTTSRESVEVVWTVTAVDPSGNSATSECRATFEPSARGLMETGGGGCSGGPGGLLAGLVGLGLVGLGLRRRVVP